jgi:hypothetical protein
MTVPKRLKERFNDRGYATLKDFSAVTGITYPNVLRRAQSGDIPAVDVSPSNSNRSQWRIYEEQAAEWFAARTTRRPAEPSDATIPDFYDEDGNWIAPEKRA